MKHTSEFYTNDGANINIRFDFYGTKDRNLGELFDWLGEIAMVIQANELYQFACLDDCGNIFKFDNEDEVRLAHYGSVTLPYTGETIEDYKESHKDFYNWFFNIR